MNSHCAKVSSRSFRRTKVKTHFALLALALCASGSSAWAQKQDASLPAAIEVASSTHAVPFKGLYSTQFQIIALDPVNMVATIAVTGQGNASHVGNSTAATTNQMLNVITNALTATYTLTAANGDTVVLEMEFQATNVAGGVTFVGSYTVAGGTGRFVGASGSGLMSGMATFTSQSTGFGSFGFRGTISSPGR